MPPVAAGPSPRPGKVVPVLVIPAKTGIHFVVAPGSKWVPARAGTTLSQSTYSELTDSPNAILRIVSASNSATDNWRIFGQFFAASDNGIVSVTTSSSSADPERFWIAGPDSTGCVA